MIGIPHCMNKETVLVHPLRRRTNSHAGILQQYDSSKPSVLNHVRRLRRTSFTLSGERPDSLDEFINAALIHASTATSEVHASPRCSISIDGPLCSSPVITVAATTTANTRQADLSNISLEGLLDEHLAAEIQPTSNSADRKEYTWHNSAVFSSNPLKSRIIKEYLAMIAVNNVFHPTPDNDLQSETSATPQPVCQDKYLISNLPSAGISTSSHYLPTASLSILGRDRGTTVHYAANVADRSIHGDAPRESCRQRSDLFNQSQLGYHSDTGLLDTTASRVKQQVSTSHRRHLLLNCSRRSRFNSPGKEFPSVGRKNTDAHISDQVDSADESFNHRLRFNVNHLYEGFSGQSDAGSMDNRLTRTTSTLQVVDSPVVSDEEDGCWQTPTKGRLRSLFRQLRPAASNVVEAAAMAVLDSGGDFPHGENDNYIYLNKEAQERRTKAQVANMITPVSF